MYWYMIYGLWPLSGHSNFYWETKNENCVTRHLLWRRGRHWAARLCTLSYSAEPTSSYRVQKLDYVLPVYTRPLLVQSALAWTETQLFPNKNNCSLGKAFFDTNCFLEDWFHWIWDDRRLIFWVKSASTDVLFFADFMGSLNGIELVWGICAK